MTISRSAAIALVAGSLVVTPTLALGEASAGRSAPLAATHAPQQQDLRAIAAQQLARAALMDFRALQRQDSTPADARYVATLLRDAVSLDESNAFILRFAIDAAAQAGDQQAVLALTRALVGIAPDDTSAQLQLIRARVGMAQNAEERLALLEGFLGPRGEKIDPSVRSRLAVDAALLRRETGDASGFVESLTAATTLDGSNTGAAALALDFYSSRIKEPEGRFELLANTLLASPLDAGIHGTLARELALAGAADQAIRFYDNAFALRRRQSGPRSAAENDADARQRVDYLVQVWRSRGPEGVVKQLNDAVDGPRREAQIELDIASATGKATDKLRKPDEIRLPLAMERLRLMAAFAAGDTSTVDRSLADLQATVAQIDRDDPERAVATAELAFLKALAGPGDITAQVQAVRGLTGVPPEWSARIEAWSKLRAGNAEGRALFEKMQGDPLAALALLAVDIENTPPADSAASRAIGDRLAALSSAEPASQVSAWALSAYRRRSEGKSPPPTAREERFTAMGAGIPAWLDEITREPSRFITVRAVTPSSGLTQLEPAIVTIKVTNNTPVPLAIGPGQAIDDQLLIISSVDSGGARAPELGKSEVASLGGRLRLLPRESVSFPVWADPGLGGWSVQNALSKTARLRLTVIQGFQIVDGAPKAGPFGTVIEAEPLGRASASLGDVARLTAEISSLQDADFALALLRARLQLIATERPLTLQQARALVGAIGERYRAATPAERVLILLLTPAGMQSAPAVELERLVDQLAETDPVVARVALLTRVDNIASPLLRKFQAFPDPGVQEAVKVIEARLAAYLPLFSRVGSAAAKPVDPPAPPAASPTPAGTPGAQPKP